MQNRYHRQELVLGKAAQQLLNKARVTIVGAGALGTVAAELLLRAGVTNLTIIDRDIIELSNLQRQTLYTESDIKQAKTSTIKNKLLQINKKANITTHLTHLNKFNIKNTIKTTNESKPDIILDCTDNIQTRLLLDIFRIKHNIPIIFASAIQTKGTVALLTNYENTKTTLNSFLPQNAQGQTCSQVGVLNTTTSTIASMQVTFTIKHLTNQSEDIQNKLFIQDIWESSINKFNLKPTKKETLEYPDLQRIQRFCSSYFQILPDTNTSIDLKQLNKQLEDSTLNKNNTILTTKNHHKIFQDKRALIKAKDKKEAKIIYSKIIGN